MYTFNLSKAAKAAKLKIKKEKQAKDKEDGNKPDNVRTTSPKKENPIFSNGMPNLSNLADKNEEKKGLRDIDKKSKDSKLDTQSANLNHKRSSSINFCPTY